MISISIDGTAGTGKSTLAKNLAKELKFNYVNTGEMYRAIAIYFLENNIDDKSDIVKILPNVNIKVEFENFEQKTFLNGRLLSQDDLRKEEVGKKASVYSQIKEVREKTVILQRNTAQNYNVVMEGRDIGSVVLPDANVKFYITADPMVRAERRYKELISKNKSADLMQIYKDIIERDVVDSTRELSPLVIPDNAIVLDTSNMSIDEVKNYCLDIIKSHIHH